MFFEIQFALLFVVITAIYVSVTSQKHTDLHETTGSENVCVGETHTQEAM